MKKVLCTIALLLLFAGSAYAQATFSMTGSYWAEGKYWFNYNDAPGTDATYSEKSFGFYEQDINLYPKITLNNTSLIFKVVVTDVYWGATDADGSEKVTAAADDPNADDDNIQVERAYMSHNFGKWVLDVGLMDGTEWGTTFGDDKQAQWRVKAYTKTQYGILGAVLEKDIENGCLGNDTDGDGTDDYIGGDEGNDRDAYGLWGITKVGGITVRPLLWYIDSMKGDTGWTLFNPVLALNGEVGGITFESEINYKMWNAQVEAANFDEDVNTLGLYLNVWKALDNMTPGFIIAYGSYDKDYIEETTALYNIGTALSNTTLQNTARALATFGAFDFEDDFDSTIILGDEYGWGGGHDLTGATLLKVYVNDIATGIDPLTVNAYAAYVMSNMDDTYYEDATAWELSVGADYKITDNLKYSVYGAYADISYDATGIDDPDSVYVVANALKFSF